MTKLPAWWPLLTALLLTVTFAVVLPHFQANVVADQGYLGKLFNSLAGKNNLDEPLPGWLTGPTGWVLGIGATLFYGEIALLYLLWILFRSDWVGIITALMLIAFALAFTLPRRPRPIGLLVLASLNALLVLGLAVGVAFGEGLYPVLLSILPAGWLWWLSVQNLIKRAKQV